MDNNKVQRTQCSYIEFHQTNLYWKKSKFSICAYWLTTLEGWTGSEIVAKNLNATQSARKAFIATEASAKTRRALGHNVRTPGDTKYISFDTAFYKRNEIDRWKDSGKVIEQDGHQILMKHGCTYI